MSFRNVLENLVAIVPGAAGAILTDWEGEAVDCCSLGDEFELKVLAAHFGIILNQLRSIHLNRAAGNNPEAAVTTSAQRILVGAVSEDYALLLTLDRNVPVAIAQRFFQPALAELRKEIA